MAGSSHTRRVLLLPPAHPEVAAGQQRTRYASPRRWEVEFARYFRAPRRSPSTNPPPGLSYLVRGKRHQYGTWLPAASAAALCISRRNHTFASPVLTVSISDVVYEEHYVSTLNFSWPQVAGATQGPIRGSRVMFMSFCDTPKQIQKFAVRFPQLSDVESFLNCVKEECSRNTMDIIPSGRSYSMSRPDEAARTEDPTSDHRTGAPALSHDRETEQPVLPLPLATNSNNIYSGLTHSFSEMLTSCPIKYEKDGGEPYPVSATGRAPEMLTSYPTKNEKGGGEPCPATATDHAPEKTYMVNDSFDDVLFKLDTAIEELGGDMLL